MKQKITLIAFLTLMVQISFYGQIIDRYGINIGASYSKQIWDYELISIDLNNDYKAGLMTFVSADKDFGEILTLRTELGYIQKGFKNNLEMTFSDGTSAEHNEENVVLHDLALNLGLKIKPFKFDYSPYLFLGCRGDYMFSYKDIVFKEQASGLEFSMYKSLIELLDNFNIGGLIGLGIDIKELLYFEIEYNPNFTMSFKNENFSIKDICWGAKLGLNINKLIE